MIRVCFSWLIVTKRLPVAADLCLLLIWIIDQGKTMAKSTESTKKPEAEEQAATPEPAKAEAAKPEQRQAPARTPIQVNEDNVVTCYANFCRVTGTPEELIIDFGLNSQPMGVPTQPLILNQRIVVNYFTAKRMLAALQMSVQRHEAAFGVLETDIQKRIVPGAFQPPPQPPAKS